MNFYYKLEMEWNNPLWKNNYNEGFRVIQLLSVVDI